MSIDKKIKSLKSWLHKNSYSKEAARVDREIRKYIIMKNAFFENTDPLSGIPRESLGDIYTREYADTREYAELDRLEGPVDTSALDPIRRGNKVISYYAGFVRAEEVAALQRLLAQEGFYDGSITEKVTRDTEDAMRDFLNSRGYDTEYAVVIGEEELADLEGDFGKVERIRAERAEREALLSAETGEGSEEVEEGGSDEVDTESVDGGDDAAMASATLDAPTEYNRNKKNRQTGEPPDPSRPPHRFAQIPGINNYRSAKITSHQQMRVLRDQYGIKVIINLALDSVDGISDPNFADGNGKPCGGDGTSARENPCEPYWAEDLGIDYHPIYVHGHGPWDVRDRWSELKGLLMTGNCLVHCTAGVDRTGAVVARWRLEVDPNLTQDQAMAYTHAFGGQWKMETDPNKSLRNFIFESNRPTTSPFGVQGASASGGGTDVEKAIELIKQREGLIFDARWDVNAFRTGFGSGTHTDGLGNVTKVEEGDTTTEEAAIRDLNRRVNDEFKPKVVEQLGEETYNGLTPDAQAALISMCYNYGSLRSEIVEAARTGDAEQLAQAIEAFKTHNGGILASRRQQEADLVRGAESIAVAGATSGAVDPDYAVILGDSQAVLEFGKAIERSISGRFSKIKNVSLSSTKPDYWAGQLDSPESKLSMALAECPALIFISLGGNGISGASSLLSGLRERCGSAKIVWSGVPPAARPVGPTWATYLLHGNFESAQRDRKQKNTDLEGIITGENVTFINPFNHMASYTCTENCDGVHLTADAANTYAGRISSQLV